MNQFDFTAQLPMKRMGVGAVLLNEERDILSVKPTYREKWLPPGGIVEAHESPGAACVREVQEELGLTVSLGNLLCIEYRSTTPPKTECLQFTFYCGIVTRSQIQQIKLPRDELSTFCFVSIDEANEKLETFSSRRMQWAWRALDTQRTIYAENGVEPAL